MARFIVVAALVAVAGCGGGSSDSGDGPCMAPVNGCSTFTDLTAGTATIEFGGALGNNYAPRCVQVKVGQPVTFSGEFGTHPLTQSCGPNQSVPSKSSGTSTTVTFASAGTWGFKCTVHAGMNGAIDVVP
jgi:plastocyanin